MYAIIFFLPRALDFHLAKKMWQVVGFMELREQENKLFHWGLAITYTVFMCVYSETVFVYYQRKNCFYYYM